MRPVTEIAKGEHGDDVSTGVCSPMRMDSRKERARTKNNAKNKERRKVRNDISGEERERGGITWERVGGSGRGRGERTFEEVTLLDAELAYAGAEPEEGKAEDGAE